MGSEVDISSVIAGWQERLLQLDRRNPLLYYRGQRSGVGILETTPDDFLDRLQKGRNGLAFSYAESRRRSGLPGREGEGDVYVVPGDIETDIEPLPLQRRLLSLHRKDREWEEEQGVDVLFVAFGFLNWIDKDGETAASPLLLVPAGLHRASPRDPWRLRLDDDDLQVNATLRHQLSRLGVPLPDFDQETLSVYLEEVAHQAVSKQGWSVEPKLALATFPFAKMAMWEDLEQMRRKGVDHPVVCALGGDSQALVSGRGTMTSWPVEGWTTYCRRSGSSRSCPPITASCEQSNWRGPESIWSCTVLRARGRVRPSPISSERSWRMGSASCSSARRPPLSTW
jgi:hypothetical protein